VFVPEENAIFTGDLIFQGSHAFMVGSNINEWLNALEWLEICGATLFLPGHGEPCSRKDVEFMYSYLIKFKKSLAVLKAKGMTAEEIARKPEMLQLPQLDKPQRISRNVMFHYEKV
jgi:glyoxylase-like metal-dependent hydrolase (beta-lactamase superfamily II)